MAVRSASVRNFPVIFFTIYLLVSVLVFAFGPCDFRISNPWALYAYILAGQLFILIGYLAGSYVGRGYNGKLSADLVLRAAILITVCSLPMTLYSRNFADLSLAEAIRDPGAAYVARLHELMGRDSIPLVSIIRAALGPAIALLLPCGIVYWRRMSVLWRCLWLGGMAGLVVESLFVGAAKGLFDLVLVIPWMVWLPFHHRAAAQRASGAIHPRAVRKTIPRRKMLLVALVVVAALTAGIKYFSHSRQSRYGMSGDQYPAWTTGWSEYLYGIPLPASVEYTTYMLAHYWTHGYVALSECLQLPFTWSYGVGHSTFLTRYVGRLMGDPEFFVNRSYPVRLEAATGYSVSSYWHTIYPWLASDFTFPGALVVIGLLAFLLSRCWQDCLMGANPFAPAFLCQLLLLFYYIPANNVRLMFSEEIVSFWGLFLAWIFTRKTTLRR
jgi:hypothetical protein